MRFDRHASGGADEIPSAPKGGVADQVTRDGASVPPGAWVAGDGSERWHGTIGGYSNHRCRCGRCISAGRSYHGRYWRARGHLIDRGAEAYRATARIVVAAGLSPEERLALTRLVDLDDPAHVPLVADLDGRAKRREQHRTKKQVVAQQHLTNLGADELPLEGELLELIAAQADDDRYGNSLRLDHDWFALERIDSTSLDTIEDDAE